MANNSTQIYSNHAVDVIPVSKTNAIYNSGDVSIAGETLDDMLQNLDGKATYTGNVGILVSDSSISIDTSFTDDRYSSSSHNHDSQYLSKTGNDTTVGSITATAFYESSDVRMKNVEGGVSLKKAYELIDKCSTILYTLKVDEHHTMQVGMLAQEVEEFFPEIVLTDVSGYKSIDYSRLTVIILKVMKDLIERIEKLEAK